MKPPYEITSAILRSMASVSQKIGEINAKYLTKQTPHLRKQNKIKTIHSSLKIEGNSLSEEQITAIIDNKKIVGSQTDIRKVVNAVEVYNDLSKFSPTSEKSFLLAHKTLIKMLIQDAGKYRVGSVGIAKGRHVKHIALSYKNVPWLMKDLFSFLGDNEMALIKSCVFHYEVEFIHPFMDGNGRMGRLWQTVILLKEYPVFEFLPFETLISQNSNEYYKALAKSDSIGKSTPFIEYMLSIIDESLNSLLNYNNRILKDSDRIEYFIHLSKHEFSRKDYMKVFKEISSATASRDLKKGIDLCVWEKEGDKKTTIYKTIKK